MSAVPPSSTMRTVLTAPAVARLALGWAAVAALLVGHDAFAGTLATPVLFAVLAGIVAVVIVCAFGVVTQAERLAHRLGDPYGTLVLTLSIVVIEVVLISAVMLGPGDHATIARDSVMAATMIVLTLVTGLALLIGGLRHNVLRPNRAGVSAYLSLLVVLLAAAFALPASLGVDGVYTPSQAIIVVALTVALYGFFLFRQTGAQADDFREITTRSCTPGTGTPSLGRRAAVPSAEDLDAASRQPGPALQPPSRHAAPSRRGMLREHGPEIAARVGVLLATVVPIVVVSHDMAGLVDDGLGRLGAPAAVSGVLIALIVFLPEGITTIRAAWAGETQRVSNLAHGALVSCVGLTLPAVLVIGLLTGQSVGLAESPANLALLAVSLLLSLTTFSGPRVTALHGATHLVVFALYGLAAFAPA